MDHLKNRGNIRIVSFFLSLILIKHILKMVVQYFAITEVHMSSKSIIVKLIMYKFQDYCILYNNAVIQLYDRVGILFTCEKHLHDRIISLRVEVGAHKISLTQSLFFLLKCPYQARKESCHAYVCVSSINFASKL